MKKNVAKVKQTPFGTPSKYGRRMAENDKELQWLKEETNKTFAEDKQTQEIVVIVSPKKQRVFKRGS
jgi:hypothetical protein